MIVSLKSSMFNGTKGEKYGRPNEVRRDKWINTNNTQMTIPKKPNIAAHSIKGNPNIRIELLISRFGWTNDETDVNATTIRPP